MVREILIDLKVSRIKNGRTTTRKFLERKRKNESYSTRCVKCMVDSSSNRFKCSFIFREND